MIDAADVFGFDGVTGWSLGMLTASLGDTRSPSPGSRFRFGPLMVIQPVPVVLLGSVNDPTYGLAEVRMMLSPRDALFSRVWNSVAVAAKRSAKRRRASSDSKCFIRDAPLNYADLY